MFDLKKCEKMKKADIYRYNKIMFDKEYNFYGLYHPTGVIWKNENFKLDTKKEVKDFNMDKLFNAIDNFIEIPIESIEYNQLYYEKECIKINNVFYDSKYINFVCKMFKNLDLRLKKTTGQFADAVLLCGYKKDILYCVINQLR